VKKLSATASQCSSRVASYPLIWIKAGRDLRASAWHRRAKRLAQDHKSELAGLRIRTARLFLREPQLNTPRRRSTGFFFWPGQLSPKRLITDLAELKTRLLAGRGLRRDPQSAAGAFQGRRLMGVLAMRSLILGVLLLTAGVAHAEEGFIVGVLAQAETPAAS
jgi:hypothetical protein